MNSKKPIWQDVGVWMLLLLNAYSVYYYLHNPNSIRTVIFIFWMQSVFIGIFNVIGMLTFTNRVSNSFTVNDSPGNKPGCAAAFFTFHYGMFHLIYFIFLVVTVMKEQSLDFQFLKISFWAIFAGCIMQYIQDKKHNRTEPINIGVMFFMPYVRIIPMHLIILVPAFFHISAPILFLALKTFADVIMHVVYRRYVFKAP